MCFGKYLSSFSEQWQKWPGKGAGWECRVRYAERHFLPLSPLLRGIVNGASDLQPVLGERRSPKKILSQECLQGCAEQSSPEVGKSFPAKCLRLEICVCPQIKSFLDLCSSFWQGFWGLWAGVSESCVGLSCHGGAVTRVPHFPVPC